MKIVVIEAGATPRVMEAPEEAGQGIYPTLRSIIGGPLEAVRTRDGATMYLHEEGKLLDPPLPRNPAATGLLYEAGGMRGDYIAGTAIICGPPDGEGYDTEAPETYLHWAREREEG